MCPECGKKVEFSHMFFNVEVYKCEDCKREYSWQELEEENHE